MCKLIFQKSSLSLAVAIASLGCWQSTGWAQSGTGVKEKTSAATTTSTASTTGSKSGASSLLSSGTPAEQLSTAIGELQQLLQSSSLIDGQQKRINSLLSELETAQSGGGILTANQARQVDSLVGTASSANQANNANTAADASNPANANRTRSNNSVPRNSNSSGASRSNKSMERQSSMMAHRLMSMVNRRAR